LKFQFRAVQIPNEWIAIVHKSDERTVNIDKRSYVLQLNSRGFIQLASSDIIGNIGLFGLDSGTEKAANPIGGTFLSRLMRSQDFCSLG
jgi:hypothetical protein